MHGDSCKLGMAKAGERNGKRSAFRSLAPPFWALVGRLRRDEELWFAKGTPS